MNSHRKHAWSNVKSAVRSYAKDPTAMNAEEVESAWAEIRRIDNLQQWREWHARFNAGNTEHSGMQSRQH